jgi:hypothetical protein
MSRYIMIRRLRFPVILLLVGVLALLHQFGIIHHFWHFFLPLLLILLGVLMLAERMALTMEGSYPSAPFPGAPDPRSATGVEAYPGQPVAYVPPDHSQSPDRDSQGGKS